MMDVEYRRSDALPEHHDYRDDGCNMHPACLTCPFPTCRYDGEGRAWHHRERDAAIVSLRMDMGVGIDAIAERFGVARRTVFRILAEARQP